MNRKSLLSIFLCLISGIALLTGCGGGGGGGNKIPENSLSSDYFGIQVNYTLNYTGIVTDVKSGLNNQPYTMTKKVISEETGVYKTQTTINILPGETWGYFIEKSEDGNYKDKGWWDGSEEHMYNEPHIIMHNPVYEEFESDNYGKVIGQESITVPAGTFNAWVFEDTSGDKTNGSTDTYYFVEYIGIVKYIGEEFEEGQTIRSDINSLTSYYISPSTKILVSSGVDFNTNSSTSLKLRKIFKNINKN